MQQARENSRKGWPMSSPEDRRARPHSTAPFPGSRDRSPHTAHCNPGSENRCAPPRRQSSPRSWCIAVDGSRSLVLSLAYRMRRNLPNDTPRASRSVCFVLKWRGFSRGNKSNKQGDFSPTGKTGCPIPPPQSANPSSTGSCSSRTAVRASTPSTTASRSATISPAVAPPRFTIASTCFDDSPARPMANPF